jgi:hypothetical protein
MVITWGSEQALWAIAGGLTFGDGRWTVADSGQ